MSELIIDFVIDIHGHMKVKYSSDGEIITTAFVSRGEGSSGLVYYFMPCERTEVKSVEVHGQEHNIDNFEDVLRDVHENHVRFIYF